MNKTNSFFTDKIKVLLKCLFNEKNEIKAFGKWFVTSIGYVSFFFSIAVLINDLCGIDVVENFCKNKWVFLILGGVFASLIHNCEKISYKGVMEDIDFQMVAEVNNLIKVKASSYIIPTNTFFRTVMEGEYISPQSVQGAFQQKYFKNNLPKLDELIESSLCHQEIEFENSEDMFGAVKKYPIGTVAKVDFMEKHFYFVAISDVNFHGKPINQRYDNINRAMTGIMGAISEFGHCDDLAIPLIGTGRAAIKEATKEKVVQGIIDSLLTYPNKIARKITICINPKDYYDGLINMKRLGEYIDYKCKFCEKRDLK